MNNEAEKRAAAERSLVHVQDGMVVGLGSGSTVAHVIQGLGVRVQAGLQIRAVASSHETARRATAAGIVLLGPGDVELLDVTIDGADEVDPDLRLIKGGGGALFREKVLATMSRRLVIVVDRSKLVPALGRFPLPVEVVPFAAPVVTRTLARWGASPRLRTGRDNAPFQTDQGNHILDCGGGFLDDPERWATRLDGLVGVVEHGLFLGFAPTLVVGG